MKKYFALSTLLITLILSVNTYAMPIQATVTVEVNDVSTKAGTFWDIGDEIIILFLYDEASEVRHEYLDGPDTKADFLGNNDDILNATFNIEDYDVNSDAEYTFDQKTQDFISNGTIDPDSNSNFSWYLEKGNYYWLNRRGDGVNFSIHQQADKTEYGFLYVWYGAGYGDQYVKFNVIDTTYNNAAPVPEPTTMLLLGSGIIGLAGFRRKFKKA